MSEFIADNIRIRTAGVCSCDAHCRSRREMRERHATPEQFEVDVYAAVGTISFDEADRAVQRYRSEYAAAPEEFEEVRS